MCTWSGAVGKDGWLSYSLDTSSRRNRWDIRQGGFPGGQGLGQLMGPQGCPDLLLNGHPPQHVLGDLRVSLISAPS